MEKIEIDQIVKKKKVKLNKREEERKRNLLKTMF